MVWIWVVLIIINVFVIKHVEDWDSLNGLLVSIWCVLLFSFPIFYLNVDNETFYKPLTETIHIKLENGIAVDTTYTYQ